MAELLMCVDGGFSAAPDPRSLTCELPAESVGAARAFLETIGTGNALGSGSRLAALGTDMPRIRSEYDRAVAELVGEVERRRALKHPASDIAEWVVNRRREIANQTRWRSGAGTRVMFEIRDWKKYGAGGRTFANVQSRYVNRGLSGAALHEQMIGGAIHPNTEISAAALKGARYLKNGGRIIVVVSVATTAYTLLRADPKDLERLTYEEAGAFLGGSAGSGLGAAACLVFGIATGGWGLLACGVIGGVVGGFAGSQASSRIYYSRTPKIETTVNLNVVLDGSTLLTQPPESMCIAR